MAEIKNIDENIKEKDGLTHYNLSRPVTYNGEEFTELDFDFEGLTGADCENIQAELRALGVVVLVESMTPEYLTRLAAKACRQKIGADFFTGAHAKDYIAIKKLVRDFLMAAE